VMIRRPPAERGPAVQSLEAALDWLAELPEPVPAAQRMS
jgi:hypothetical protein